MSRNRNIGERIHRLILGMCVSAPPHLFLSLLYIISLSEIASAKRTRDERERSSRRGSWKKRDIVTQERQQQSGQRARATRATRVTQGDTVPNLGERGREHCGSPPFLLSLPPFLILFLFFALSLSARRRVGALLSNSSGAEVKSTHDLLDDLRLTPSPSEKNNEQ